MSIKTKTEDLFGDCWEVYYQITKGHKHTWKNIDLTPSFTEFRFLLYQIQFDLKLCSKLIPEKN